MNGNTKFHKATGPAFNPGEVWISSNGSKVEVQSVYKHENGNTDAVSDYSVIYKQTDGSIADKDCWNFQVRYSHSADKDLK